MNAPTARLQRLERALQAQVNAWRLQPVVAALQARRGVPGSGAVTTVAELGALTRVNTPRARMHGFGLPPSASSTGARRRQGASPTTGTTQARRALVEGAWAYCYPAKGSRHLQRRLEHPPKGIQALSGKAHGRLGTRDRRRMARGTPASPVVVAMARELVGLLGAMAQQMPGTPSVSVREGEAPQLRRVATALGRGAAPVWCHPRRRDEAATTPRAERAAGPRRTPVSWSPTDGEPPAHPSSLTGAGAAEGRKWT